MTQQDIAAGIWVRAWHTAMAAGMTPAQAAEQARRAEAAHTGVMLARLTAGQHFNTTNKGEI